MQHSPKRVGLIQALGLVTYIELFAVSVFKIGGWAQAHNITPHPIAGIILFLLAFVTSALICSSIVFAYPVSLFFEGNKRDALRVIFWTALSLIGIFAVIALTVFVLSVSFRA